MSGRRPRALLAVAAALAVAALLAVLLLARGDDADSAERYARSWQAACGELRADTRRTTAAIERAGGGAAARAPVLGWLTRTAATLRSLERATPPARWRAYHRRATVALTAATRRLDAVRRTVERGDLEVLARVDLGSVAATPEAPPDLRRRTPACVAGTAGAVAPAPGH